ncbi:MAG: hypothetical protein JW878_09065 [Methanomicrobia archaeon]|nr:hypothetical protein [Methanomicrobia archaeon]
MNKKEKHKQDLVPLFDEFLETGNADTIVNYLLANSNLPGPRGNLELAVTFAEVVEELFAEAPEQLWRFCSQLAVISADEAPVNDPKEFLPFCGACAVGALGAVSAACYQEALTQLRGVAGDLRWRMREGVAMALQRLIETQSETTLTELEGWIANGDWLAMRAVAAGVAEPLLLREKQTAARALALHKKIFDRIVSVNERKSEQFTALKKGLGYTLSVVIAAIPEEGFAYMEQLIESRKQDKDIRWILKENLKKNRLAKNFPNEVAALKHLLQ